MFSIVVGKSKHFGIFHQAFNHTGSLDKVKFQLRKYTLWNKRRDIVNNTFRYSRNKFVSFLTVTVFDDNFCIKGLCIYLQVKIVFELGFREKKQLISVVSTDVRAGKVS